MKKLSLLFVLILILIPTIVLADAVGSYSRASIAVTIPVPKAGEHPSFDGVLAASNGIKIDSVKWYNVSNEEMTKDSTFFAGTTYKVKVDVSRTGGDAFRTGNLFSVYVNNSTNNVIKDNATNTANFVSFTWSYKIESERQQTSGRISNATGGKAQYLETPEPIKQLDFTFQKFEYGKNPPQIKDITWNKDLNTAIEITKVTIKGEQEKRELSSTDTFGEGGYVIYINFKLLYDYTLDSNLKVTFNGYNAVKNTSETTEISYMMRSSVKKPDEPILIKEPTDIKEIVEIGDPIITGKPLPTETTIPQRIHLLASLTIEGDSSSIL